MKAIEDIIPDAAVEAAARADYYNIAASPDDAAEAWETYIDREWWLNNSRIALLAAAPHIAAQALEDFADAHRMPWTMFLRDDGSPVTVGDLMREVAARYRMEKP